MIKYFLNKTTGLVWDTDNKDMIKRLSKDSEYEEVSISDPEPEPTIKQTQTEDKPKRGRKHGSKSV